MGIQDTVAWYQKKIGTYDKQQWELTFERRIIRGYNHVQMKSTRPKTELIDVDLVQGVPENNCDLNFLHFSTDNCDLGFSDSSTDYIPAVQSLPYTVVVIPLVMMWILSFIHSQIVATNPEPQASVAHRVITKATNTSTDKAKKSQKRVNFKQVEEFQVENIPGRSAEEVSSISRSSAPVGNQANEGQSNIDDGFESFNGVGSNSSDNGDDILHFQASNARSKQSDQGSCTCSETDSPTKDFKKLESTVSGDLESYNCRVYELLRKKIAMRKAYSKMNSESDSEEEHKGKHKFKDTEKNSSDSDEEAESDECTTTSPEAGRRCHIIKETASVTELGFTSNSEDSYYATDLEQSEGENENDMDFLSNNILNPDHSNIDKVSCTVWEGRELKKAYLSVLDISSAIVSRVEQIPERMDYFYLGIFLSLLLFFTPAIYRLSSTDVVINSTQELRLSLVDLIHLRLDNISTVVVSVLNTAMGSNSWERAIIVIASLERFILASAFFFLLAVAERTYKQRFLYAKFFTRLTSSQKARKSDLPHFRLNKVRNIKTWLSVRSYLKKRGPQRSVDVIVSAAFVITLLLLSFLSMELLKGSEALRLQYNLEALVWSFGLGIMLLRFMTLGNNTYRKYRNLSVLITEQINLYLQIEHKPRKKEKLSIANNVLKLAADLLKELETPYKISGLSANPYLYTIIKVFILSALSAVLSELLGFKLKLFKISIKS